MQVVLGSGSPRRLALMAQLPVDVEVVVPDVDEAAIVGPDPIDVAARRATAKFDAIAAEHAAPIIAADTVVIVDGDRLGKPTDLAHARAMLERLSGQTVEIVTAVVVGPEAHATPSRVTTSVQLRALDGGDIDAYLETTDVLDKAGALALQDGAAGFIASLDGCWSNVVGLPLCRVAELLKLGQPPCQRAACGTAPAPACEDRDAFLEKRGRPS